jgi:hypothetical protein
VTGFPATVAWEQPVRGVLGPSIHWNTYLQQYVMLLNRAQEAADSEGIYISYSTNLADPPVVGAGRT